ncbi:GatB/YqeY domain-containing protein [Motiliproteus sp.]|uniref:GatB/YqeY domain-containing protein n=1 Tax=Motiliproteus sp. TaxID=1898955 RepID=UPI003BA884F1
MTDCALKSELKAAQKDAMRAKDKDRLKTLRSILSAIKDVEVNERIELDDARVIAVLDKMQKQRNDSIAQFDAAGRDDLSEVEKKELEVIKQFLPAQLTDQEIDQLIDQAISETGASSMREMGQVMGRLKPQLQGRADMAVVSKQIKAKLS